MEEDSSQSKGLHDVTLFDMATIASSTDNFAAAAKLGEGGFGAVYKVNIATFRGIDRLIDLRQESDNNCCKTNGWIDAG